MTRVYGEPVAVQTGEDGRPARFVWRNRAYTVLGVQDYWVVNRAWWRETGQVPVQPELQFWRVEATPGTGHTGYTGRSGQNRRTGRGGRTGQPGGSYELRRDAADGAWTLRQIAD